MKKIHSVLIGFLTAPLVAAVLGTVLTPLGMGYDNFSRLCLLPIFYFFSFLATLFFGTPIYLLLEHWKFVNWWTSLGAGVAVGILAAAVLRLPDMVEIRDFTSIVPISAASALGFYFIWRQGK